MGFSLLPVGSKNRVEKYSGSQQPEFSRRKTTDGQPEISTGNTNPETNTKFPERENYFLSANRSPLNSIGPTLAKGVRFLRFFLVSEPFAIVLHRLAPKKILKGSIPHPRGALIIIFLFAFIRVHSRLSFSFCFFEFWNLFAIWDLFFGISLTISVVKLFFDFVSNSASSLPPD